MNHRPRAYESPALPLSYSATTPRIPNERRVRQPCPADQLIALQAGVTSRSRPVATSKTRPWTGTRLSHGCVRRRSTDAWTLASRSSNDPNAMSSASPGLGGHAVTQGVLVRAEEAAPGVTDDDDLVRPEQLLADDQRADDVVGGEAAGVADDVGVAHVAGRAPADVEPRVHAGDDGQAADRRGRERRMRRTTRRSARWRRAAGRTRLDPSRAAAGQSPGPNRSVSQRSSGLAGVARADAQPRPNRVHRAGAAVRRRRA